MHNLYFNPSYELVGMNPKAKNSCAERRAPSKIEQAGCPETIWKKFSRTNSITDGGCRFRTGFPKERKNFTDVGRRYEFERGKIKYTKAVNVFGLVTKSWQSKLTIKRYEKHSKRQGARANHPKQPALPERRAPQSRAPHPSAQSRLPHSSAERRAPSAHFFRASRLWGVSFQLGRTMTPIFRPSSDSSSCHIFSVQNLEDEGQRTKVLNSSL